MTKGIIQTTIESSEYNFHLIKGLTESNENYKNGIKEILDVIECPHGVPNLIWIENKLKELLNK